MTILSAQSIRGLALPQLDRLPGRLLKFASLPGMITPFRERFVDSHGNSGGLGPCGYDLTLAHDIPSLVPGEFVLAAAAEHFVLPNNILMSIKDKSSWARKGLAVQNTVAEPGWRGYLTLELTNHGPLILRLMKGAAICQVIFELLDEPTEQPYTGKYQDQPAGPQEALVERPIDG